MLASFGKHRAEQEAKLLDAGAPPQLVGEHSGVVGRTESDQRHREPDPEHAESFEQQLAFHRRQLVELGVDEAVDREQERIDLRAWEPGDGSQRLELLLGERCPGLGHQAGDGHHGLTEAPKPRVVLPGGGDPVGGDHRIEAADADLVGRARARRSH